MKRQVICFILVLFLLGLPFDIKCIKSVSSIYSQTVADDVVYLTSLDIKPEILPTGMFALTPPKFMEAIYEIEKTVKGIILDESVMSEIDKSLIRTFLLEHRKAIFVIGKELSPDYLQNSLEIERAAHVKFDPESKNVLVANGLFYKGNEVFQGVNILSPVALSLRVLLRETQRQINYTQTSQSDSNSQGNSPTWDEKDVQTNVYFAEKEEVGRYVQTLKLNKLRDDASSFDDYWYLKFINLSISGDLLNKDKCNKCQNIRNKVKADVDIASHNLISYGPTENVAENQTASVLLDAVRPHRNWDWQTMYTFLINTSNQGDNYGEWQIDFVREQEQALERYEWLPGIETKSGQDDIFKIYIKNEVEWLDDTDRSVPCNKCNLTYSFAPN